MSLQDMFFQDSDGTDFFTCNGILTGIVKNNFDENFPGMVQVELFMGEEGKCVTPWIRVMQPYCGPGYGQYFFPEIGAEVVVGFIMGDMNYPIVLGCTWNAEDAPPEGKVADGNPCKSIFTKGGHEIRFDEGETAGIDIKTAAGNDILLDDTNQIVTITGSAGTNSITINDQEGSLKIAAEKSVEIAVGSVTVSINGEENTLTINSETITIEATKELNLKGQTTNVQGNTIQIKSDGQMKAEASGTLELKGSMAKIN